MDLRTLIKRRLAHALERADAEGGVNAVVAANVGQPGSVTAVSSTTRVVRRSTQTASADTTREGGPHGRGTPEP